MNLYFFTETRFCRIDGIVFAPEQMSMALWERYLSTFDHIYVCARMTESSKPIMKGMVPVISDKVSFMDIPYYVGPYKYFLKSWQIKTKIKSLIKPGNAYILRVPGMIGSIAATYLIRKNIPYASEVVGDPEEVFSNGANSSKLSLFFKYNSMRRLKRTVASASAALYVTDYTLQKKYPCSKNAFTIGASNVILRDEDYLSKEPIIRNNLLTSGEIKFMSIGTLAQMYKAPDVVLKALALLKAKGINFHLTWFGDGIFRSSMIKLAQRLGISANVSFPGNVLRDDIEKEFENIDLFLHASRAEGLPRALLEAMAKGKPAIGTRIAGIPEILSAEAIIPVNDPVALSDKILNLLNNPILMQRLASENLHTAKRFHKDILTNKRNQFFTKVKKISAQHNSNRVQL